MYLSHGWLCLSRATTPGFVNPFFSASFSATRANASKRRPTAFFGDLSDLNASQRVAVGKFRSTVGSSQTTFAAHGAALRGPANPLPMIDAALPVAPVRRRRHTLRLRPGGKRRAPARVRADRRHFPNGLADDLPAHTIQFKAGAVHADRMASVARPCCGSSGGAAAAHPCRECSTP